MLSYSVVFIKKINLLSLRYRCFPGKFTNFLKKFLNSDNLLTGYEQKSFDQFFRNLSSCVVLYKQKVDSCFIKVQSKFINLFKWQQRDSNPQPLSS